MQSAISHTDALGSSNPTNDIASGAADPRETIKVPARVLVSLANSVIRAQREALDDRDAQIESLLSENASLRMRLAQAGEMLDRRAWSSNEGSIRRNRSRRRGP